MKRILAVAIAVGLLVSTCGAFALDIDMSKYSDNEIVELFECVKQELTIRGLGKEKKIPQGFYAVGMDIPAGRYTIRKVTKDSFISFWVSPDINHLNPLESIVYEMISSNEDKEINILLADGNILFIDDSEAFIRPFEAITFD